MTFLVNKSRFCSPITNGFLLLTMLGVTIGLSGCQTHNISYPLMNAQKATDSSQGKSRKSLRVDLFDDTASKEQNIHTKRGSEFWRINGREGYPGGQIAPGVSRMIARHLKHSETFSTVSGPGSSNADLILKGTIAEFSASGKINVKAEKALAGGSLAGVGGAAVAGAGQRAETTKVFSKVRLTNLRIVDAKTGRTVWTTGQITSSSSQAKTQFLKADADVLFRRADWELRRAVDQLKQRLSKANL